MAFQSCFKLASTRSTLANQVVFSTHADCSVNTWFKFIQSVKQDPSCIFCVSAFLSTEKANSLFHDTVAVNSPAAAFA